MKLVTGVQLFKDEDNKYASFFDNSFQVLMTCVMLFTNHSFNHSLITDD